VAAASVYVSKLLRLPLLDADGTPIGSLQDVVVAPAHEGRAPRVLGLVASVQRRRIFVNAGRVRDLGPHGARLDTAAIDVRHFHLRPGELLVSGGLMGRRVAGETVRDVGLCASTDLAGTWEVSTVALRPGGGIRRRTALRVVPWQDARVLFDAGPEARDVVELRDLHPSDVARRVRELPVERRRRLAEVMEDERLADLLEELPEAEQLRLIEGLDTERVAHVLEEMEPDDAVDLLAEMSGEDRREVLEAMDPEEADDLRRLLRYGERTAGGLMTPEPVVLTPERTVAEALARLRDSEVPVALAAQVFVAEPPLETPTGPYLGVVGFQRLLREAPATRVGSCLDPHEPVHHDLPEAEVAERVARYDLLAVAVCDDAGRLVGAVTVDDVLDRVLPVGWRQGQA
jgi:CBS domain-containing protein